MKTSTAPIGYWQLLVQNAEYRKLFVGQVVSLLGDWFNFIAVQYLVYDLTNSALAAGIAIIAGNLPPFFLTPLAGVFADRFDRRKIMIVADIARGLLALGMLLVRTSDQIWLIYVFTAALITFTSFFNPAQNAAIPNLVKREELLTANALSNSAWGFMLTAGAVIGGIVIALVGRDLAFIINSLSFFVSALTIFLIRVPFSAIRRGTTRNLNPFADFNEGLAFAWKRPQVLALTLVKLGGGLAGGVLLLYTVFSLNVFKEGPFGIGLLQAARGAGVLVGPLIVRAVAKGRVERIQQLIMLGFFVSGLAYFLFGIAPMIYFAMGAAFLAHIGWGSNWVSSSVLLQQFAPDYIRGRIFSIDFGLVQIAIALSTFLAGAAIETFEPRTIAFGLSAIMFTYGVIWTAGVLWSQRTHPTEWIEGNLYDSPQNRKEEKE